MSILPVIPIPSGQNFEIAGRIIDVVAGRIFPGRVVVQDGRIAAVHEEAIPVDAEQRYIAAPFVDSHMHTESTLCAPAVAASLAVRHGTGAIIADPHEIANVLGMPGVYYMLDEAAKVPQFHLRFGAPSCVPATSGGLETAGADLGIAEVEELLARDDIYHLAEMMNYPGVIGGDPVVLGKLDAAKRVGKPIDGHAPGIVGTDGEAFFNSGPTTDHECFTYDEGRWKLQYGVKVMIREGSAARNFAALHPLISEFPGQIMFCTDDLEPTDLENGHINLIIARALALGHDPITVFRAATKTPVEHYAIPLGMLQPGDSADMVIIDDLAAMRVAATYLGGTLVAVGGESLMTAPAPALVNRFDSKPFASALLEVHAGPAQIRIIRALDGQLVTDELITEPLVSGGMIVSDTKRDILKISIKSRYSDTPPAVAFINGFGFRRGAVAMSIGHDCHNVIGIGADDRSLAEAMNAVIEARGGIAVVDGGKLELLPLPIAGLMSDLPGPEVAARYARVQNAVRALGGDMTNPVMTLSFMALLVIPRLKLSDRGLFDGRNWKLVGIGV